MTGHTEGLHKTTTTDQVTDETQISLLNERDRGDQEFSELRVQIVPDTQQPQEAAR